MPSHVFYSWNRWKSKGDWQCDLALGLFVGCLFSRSIYIYIYICVCVCMYMCVYVCVCMYMCVCVCVCICVYMCVYMCIYMCVYIYMYMYICECIYMYICICVYIYINTTGCIISYRLPIEKGLLYILTSVGFCCVHAESILSYYRPNYRTKP